MTKCLSHYGKSEEKQAKIAKINLYYIQKLAYFLESLKSIREGDENVLDNSLIVCGSGISDGDRHNHEDLPVLLAGTGGALDQLIQGLLIIAGQPMDDLVQFRFRSAFALHLPHIMGINRSQGHLSNSIILVVTTGHNESPGRQL